MTSATQHQATGLQGEEAAVHHLRGKGYRIRETNVRSRLGEIDIVADAPADGAEPLLVFIEVKTRRSTRFGSPAEAVTADKQRRMVRLAQSYLQRHPRLGQRACRFDVIGIILDTRGTAVIDHITDAFQADGP